MLFLTCTRTPTTLVPQLLRTLKHRGATGVLYYARDHEPESELGGSRVVLKIEESGASKTQMEVSRPPT